MATDGRTKITADPGRWRLLGDLLRFRREELGYKYRPEFARERMPLTPKGNANVRLVVDIEAAPADRQNTFMRTTLQDIAQFYEVTFGSMMDVLHEKADELTAAPAAPRPAVAPPAAPDPPDFPGPAPFADEARAAAARPHAEAIRDDLIRLDYLREVAPGRYEHSGAPMPSGAELFGRDTADARTWDDPNLRRVLTVRQMVWLLADIRRSDEARAAGGNSSGAAGALVTGAVS